MDIAKAALSAVDHTLNYVHSILRIGTGSLVLLFDLFLIGIVLFDLITISTLDLDVYHVSFVSNIWNNFSPYYVAMAVILVYTPPIIAAATYFIFRNVKPVRHSRSIKTKNCLYVLHVTIAIAFSFFVSVSNELAERSGSRGFISEETGLSMQAFEYTPLFSVVMYWVIVAVPVLVLLARGFATLYLWAYPSPYDSPSRFSLFKELNYWFQLSDISSDFFPVHAAHLVFANTASMAPSIRWVVRREEMDRDKYQKMVPTSDRAKHYLKEAAEENRECLRQTLLPGLVDRSAYSLEFFSGTSRTFEVGLSRLEGLQHIVVTPYEHFGQLRVVEWFSRVKGGVTYDAITLDPTKLILGWEEQRDWLVQELQGSLHGRIGKIAILISEVYYVTGLNLQIRDVIERIRESTNQDVVFIVDGSQAVGNIEKPLSPFIDCLRNDDFYYFSAHKWLLSPNTCGVLVTESRRNTLGAAPQPYDVFGPEPPSATIDPGTIFGLHASLQFLTSERVEWFRKRTSYLKEYFLANLDENLEPVRSLSPHVNVGDFLAIRPTQGFKWREDDMSRFWQELRRAGIDLTMLTPSETNTNTWWLRISFPYFMQLHAIKKLLSSLRQLVIEAP